MTNKTKYLYLACRLLSGPLEAFYMLLIFILCKELDINSLQITILASSKSIVCLFAFYFSSAMANQRNHLRLYLIFFNLLGSLPCLLFPFVENSWYFIVSYILFLTSLKTTFPAWNETLKSEVGLSQIGGIVSKGISINYLLSFFIPLIFSYWMDHHFYSWKWLFFICAILQIATIFVLVFLKDKQKIPESNALNLKFIPFLKKGWKAIKENQEFTNHLLLFFLGGIGLVMMQPLIPRFFKENLNLSYQQLALAFSFCKGIGFVCSSPLWASLFKKISLYLMDCYVNSLTFLFIVLLLISNFQIFWIYPAYLVYGMMQAGCEMDFNLSGPIYSQNKESTVFSGLNLAFTGLRGMICPVLGQLLFAKSNIFSVFFIAGCTTLISVLLAIWLENSYKIRKKQVNVL